MCKTGLGIVQLGRRVAQVVRTSCATLPGNGNREKSWSAKKSVGQNANEAGAVRRRPRPRSAISVWECECQSLRSEAVQVPTRGRQRRTLARHGGEPAGRG